MQKRLSLSINIEDKNKEEKKYTPQNHIVPNVEPNKTMESSLLITDIEQFIQAIKLSRTNHSSEKSFY